MRLLKFRLVPASSRGIFLILIILSFYIVSFSAAATSKGSSSVGSKSNKSQASHSAKIKRDNPTEESKARQTKRHQKRFHPISLNATNNANATDNVNTSNAKFKVSSSKNIPVLVFPTSHSWRTSKGEEWPNPAVVEILKTKVTTKNATSNHGKASKKSKNSTKTVKKELHKQKISIKPTDITHFTYSDIRPNAGMSVPTPTNITVSHSNSQSRFVSTNKPPEIKVSRSSSSSSSSSSVSSPINPYPEYPLPNHYGNNNNNNVHEMLKVEQTNILPSHNRISQQIIPSPPYISTPAIYPPPAPYPFPVPVPPRVPLNPYTGSPFPDMKWAGFDFGNIFNEQETARGISSQIGPGVRHKGHFGSRPSVQSLATAPIIAAIEIESNEKLSPPSPFESNTNLNSKGKSKNNIKAYGSNKQSSQEKHHNKEKQKEKHHHKDNDNDNEKHASQEKHFYGEPNLPKHSYVSTAGLSPGVDPGPGILPYFESSVTHYEVEPPPKPLPIRKKSTPDGLVPLDKRVVYICMVFSWIFWVVTMVTYYHWGEKFGHPVPGKPGFYFNHPIIFTVPPDGSKPYFHRRKRSIEGSLPGGKWNFTRVLEMIDLAQKTYEGFDWQSVDCQKKVLCEISHKNSDLGETGRKITSSISYYTGATDKFIDALEGLPVPQIIQFYLKQYKEAIAVGKQANKDCAQTYTTCKFSLKQLFLNKSIKKTA